MVAGFDRYFQIARCFRDEDLRADRQPEFTQIDLEASFVGQEDVLPVVEQVLVDLWDEAGHAVAAPFPRLALSRGDGALRHRQARPALRLRDPRTSRRRSAPMPRRSCTRRSPHGGRVRGDRGARRWRRCRARSSTRWPTPAKAAGAGGLIWARRTAMRAGRGRASRRSAPATLRRDSAPPTATLLLAVAGADSVTSPALHAVRTRADPAAGRRRRRRAHAFCWVVDFPLFEHDPDDRASGSSPTTRSRRRIPMTSRYLESEPWRCRALHYDAVYNGNELGSGSIRITDPALQRTVFRLLGHRRRRSSGAASASCSTRWRRARRRTADSPSASTGSRCCWPGRPSLRDVIAFPKTAAARALFEGAPTRGRAAR